MTDNMVENAVPVESAEELTEEEYYEEADSRPEIIASCYNAISATEVYDTGMESGVNVARIKRIRRMSLRLIDHYISELYAEHFDEEE